MKRTTWTCRLALAVGILSVLIAPPRPLSAAQGDLFAYPSGTTTISFDVRLLDQLDVLMETAGQVSSADRNTTLVLPIDEASRLSMSDIESLVQGQAGGVLSHRVGFSLTAPGGQVRVDTLFLRPIKGGASSFVLSGRNKGEEEVVLFEVQDAKIGYDDIRQNLLVEGGALSITEALATRLGNPSLRGHSVGTITTLASVRWSGGSRPALSSDDPVRIEEGSIAGTSGPDVIVGELYQTRSWGTIEGTTSFSVGTISCNKGVEPLSWVASTNQHPVIAQNLFRLKDGQFEHLGQSWLKHAFLALTGNSCGLGCTPPGTGALLGIGCSDPYSSNLNGSQAILGPKFEVNAHTGSFLYPFFSRFVTGDAIFKRLQVRNADLDPSQNADALYFVEGQYVTPDDAAAGNQDNNTSYRRVVISAGPVGTGTACQGDWCLNLVSTTQREQPAIRAWQDNDPDVIETDVRVPGEGLMILAAKATDLGDGFWHYEYALQNLNSDRSARSFVVPLPAAATVRNIGFHDVAYHSGEPFDLTDWTSAVVGEMLVWSTVDVETNSDANALRWGTLYNFRFDANAEPDINLVMTIGLFKPGNLSDPDSVTAVSVGPAGQPPVCGNDLVENGEACDPPDGLHCDPDCQWICGDGVVQEGEDCDPPNGVTCDNQCGIIYICGDGVVDPGEDCDPPDGIVCDDICRRIPQCGDGFVDPGEECDPPNGESCDEFCQRNSNDLCEDAFDVCTGVFEGNSLDATNDGEACGSSSSSPDIWYRYTPSFSGTAFASTCGSLFDTVISVHTTCPGLSNNQIVCNDDFCGLQSRVNWDVVAGTSYLIRVSGFGGAGGTVTLTISGPDCFACDVDADCPDTGNACTAGVCVGAVCIETDVEGSCDDGNDCTTVDTCQQGVCVGGGDPPPCTDQQACTDCNNNGFRDDCEGRADCNGNGILDECEFADCNENGITDVCDIASGTSLDCDGGAIGSVPGGRALFGSKCFACHGADGSGGIGPDIRNHSRIELWNQLLPPTTHSGGAHPEYTDQDFADLEAFLATAGSGARPDRIPDECQVAEDCDGDAISDACELEQGSQIDLNHDGIPDDCPSDCNNNGRIDSEEIADGSALDCNRTGFPDECDIAAGLSLDLNENGIPDECDAPTKVDLTIDGPSTVVGGQSANYTATAHFNNNSSFEVTIFADWSVTPELVAIMDGFGRLATASVPCDQTIAIHAVFTFGGVTRQAEMNVILTSDGRLVCDDGDPCTIDSCADGQCATIPDSADSDGDTVLDCVDVCPGFDDRDDCDGDRTPDGCEPDSDGNGIPDDCDQPGDFDHNGRIDLADYAGVISCYANSGPGIELFFSGCFPFDMDGDTDLDLLDISYMLANWDGPPPAGP